MNGEEETEHNEVAIGQSSRENMRGGSTMGLSREDIERIAQTTAAEVSRRLYRQGNKLPELLQDELLKASAGIISVIDYLEVQAPDLLEKEAALRDICSKLKVMADELPKIRGILSCH